MEESGEFVSVLWKSFALALFGVFSDETTDVEESGTTAVQVVSSGTFPQYPDCQPNSYTQNDDADNGKSSDVNASIGVVPISREDVDWLRCHRGF